MVKDELIQSVIANSVEGIIICNTHDVIIHASRTAIELGRGNIVGKNFDSTFSFLKVDGKPVTLARLHSGKIPNNTELVIMEKGQQKWYIVLCGTLGEDDKVLGTIITLTDITERKRSEEEILRLNRELRAISDCNQVMVRAKTEKELCKAVSTIMCDVAGYRMAWVGIAKHDRAKSVRPCGWGGTEDGYLSEIKVTWADNELGRGPTGKAIRSGKTQFMQDFDSVPSGAPWRKAAIARGYRSSIALPLKNIAGEVIGAFMLYADRPNAFFPEEVKLLEELADDLGFGIMAVRNRAERHKAEEALHESEAKFRAIADYAQMQISVARISDGTLLYTNSNYDDAFGFTPGELIGHKTPELYFDPNARMDLIAQLLKEGVVRDHEIQVKRKDGTPFWVSISLAPLDYAGEKAVIGASVDITERKQMEAALRESEEKFRAFAENTDVQIIMSTIPEGIVLYTNPSFEQKYGYATGELVGYKTPNLYYDLEERKRVLDGLLTKGFINSLEMKGKRKDGTWFWNSLTSRVITMGEQKVAITAAVDISERKAIQLALEESEARFRAIADNSMIQISVSTSDGTYLYANPTYEKAFGFPVNSLVGKKSLNFYVDPADRTKIIDTLKTQGLVENYEVKVKKQDGTPFWVSGSICFINYGGEQVILGTSIDITERKQVEEELRESEEKFRAIADNAQMLISVSSVADGKIFYLNPAYEKTFGYAHNELIGHKGPELYVDPKDRAPITDALTKGKVLRDYEIRVKKKDGTLFWISASMAVINYSGQQAIISASLDVTERKEQEEKLRKSEQRFRSLFTSMSEGVCEHEIVYNKKGKPVDYRILECNPTYEQITQIPHDDAVGKTASELYGIGEPPYFGIYAQVAETGEPAFFETYFPPMQKHFAISVFSPGKGRFVTVFQDVTERKRQLEVINGLAKFPEENPNAVLRVMHDGTLIYHNSGSESLLRQWKIKIGEKLPAKAMANLAEALNKNKVVEEEIAIDETYLSCLYVPLKNVDYVNIYCRDITGRKQAEDETRRFVAIQQAISAILEEALQSESEEEFGKTCLKIAEEITSSKFGFIGEINSEGILDDIAISDPGWKVCQTRIKQGHGTQPPSGFKIHGLYGKVLNEGNPFFTNQPTTEKESIGVPEGHPPLQSFLGIPLIQGKKTVGMIALANKPGGYSQAEVDTISAIAPAIVQALMKKRADEALHKAHTLLEAVTSGTEVIIAAIDQDYRYIFFNQAYKEELFRLTGKEVSLGMTVDDLYADMPEQQKISLKEWNQVLNGETTNLIARFGKLDKYQRTYSIHYTPLVTSGGAVFGAGEASIDITALEEARQELQKAHDELEIRVVERTGELIVANKALVREQQRFQEVLDMLPVYIILLDKDYHVPFDNKFFRDRFGKSFGKRCFEYLFQRTEPCEVCETYKIYDVNKPLEWEWTGPDGHNYYIYDFPFTDTDGSNLIMEVGVDITERKKAEAALKQAHDELEIRVEERTLELKETRDYLENLINYANAPIIVWDTDSKITVFNHAFERLTGRTATEMMGKKLNILFPEENRAHALIHVNGATKGKRMEVEEIPIQHVDGTVRTVLWNSATLYDASGAPVATIAQGQDITERKEMEKNLWERTVDLEQANRELEAFSFSVSHDLRAPLRSIDGFSQLILRRYFDKLDDKGKDYLDELRRSSQLMAQLMDDILTLSRISRYELSRDKVDLSELAISVAKELKKSQPEHNVEFVIAHDLQATGDERLIKIVLENLMGNSYKFTGKTKKAKIEVDITEIEGGKAFFVRDNGAGFDMAFIDKLFKPFHRLHTPAEFPGTGIGLASVQRIVERHGGRVWAEAELDKGATFYFTLPGA